jgi:N,N-dimethylformamidase beta subunit-like protein
VPFIVRAPVGNRAAILVQASVSTWQAYNNWAGKSLYAAGSTQVV